MIGTHFNPEFACHIRVLSSSGFIARVLPTAKLDLFFFFERVL